MARSSRASGRLQHRASQNPVNCPQPAPATQQPPPTPKQPPPRPQHPIPRHLQPTREEADLRVVPWSHPEDSNPGQFNYWLLARWYVHQFVWSGYRHEGRFIRWCLEWPNRGTQLACIVRETEYYQHYVDNHADEDGTDTDDPPSPVERRPPFVPELSPPTSPLPLVPGNAMSSDDVYIPSDDEMGSRGHNTDTDDDDDRSSIGSVRPATTAEQPVPFYVISDSEDGIQGDD